jgi:hypothetical protein
VTGKTFAEGEHFYTLLFDEKTGYRREDLSEEAFRNLPPMPRSPFPSGAQDTLRRPRPSPKRSASRPPRICSASIWPKQVAGVLVEENKKASARYLLAVMLERKRILKEVETKRAEDGSLIRVYEHAKTGEVFIIPDPELKLDQLEEVQAEVGALLG